MTEETNEYERGFIDGMQKQMQSSVDKAVNAMSKREGADSGWRKRQVQKVIEDDDDIQDYKKPWVGLTDDEVYEIYGTIEKLVGDHWDGGGTILMFPTTLYQAFEAKLKERNT
jgi:hypothetical protein